LDVLAQPRLCLLPEATSLVCSDREVRLSPVRFEIYRLLVERRLAGCGAAECAGCARCFVPAAEIAGAFRAALFARMRARGSTAVHETKWGGRNFLSEVSKIREALDTTLQAASAPFRITAAGQRGSLLYGIRLPAQAIVLT